MKHFIDKYGMKDNT